MLRLNNGRASLTSRGSGVVGFASRNVRSNMIHGNNISLLRAVMIKLSLSTFEGILKSFLPAVLMHSTHHSLRRCPAV